MIFLYEGIYLRMIVFPPALTKYFGF